MKLEIGQPSTDEQLLATYEEISSRARGNMKSIVGNPIILKPHLDRRFSLSNLGLLENSAAGIFLRQATKTLGEAEPNIKFQQNSLLHLTFGEVVYNEFGRQRGKDVATGANPEKIHFNGFLARQYHQALQVGMNHFPDPIRLKLTGIIPTLDPISGYGQTAAVVAAFITEGDETIYRVRNDIIATMKSSGLPLSSRLGAIKVLFVTLGRFIEAPIKEDGVFPLLKVLDEINEAIPNDCRTTINKIDLIATATNYPDASGHIFLSPSIYLNQLYRLQSQVTFQRPWQRAAGIR